MSSVVISGDTSGAITLAAPAVAGTNTATLPAATGTVMVSGNMPAFSAYASGTQSLTQNVTTKVTFGAEYFDTNNNFASSTFTPTVAGYYSISSKLRILQSASTGASIFIYKNGASYSYFEISAVNAAGYGTVAMSDLIQMNGTTDYLEIYVQCSGLTPSINTPGTPYISSFSGFLARSA